MDIDAKTHLRPRLIFNPDDVKDEKQLSVIKHRNVLSENTFDLVLEDGRTANFIEIFRRSLDETFGKNKWILSIGGSLVNLDIDGKVLWDGAGDVDVRVFLAREASCIGKDPMAILHRISEEIGLPIIKDVDPDKEYLYLQLRKDKRLFIDIKSLEFEHLIHPEAAFYNYNPFDYYTDSTGSLELLNQEIANIPLEDIVTSLFYCYSKMYLHYSAIINRKLTTLKPRIVGSRLAKLSRILGRESLRQEIVRKFKRIVEKGNITNTETLISVFSKYEKEFDPKIVGEEILKAEIRSNLENFFSQSDLLEKSDNKAIFAHGMTMEDIDLLENPIEIIKPASLFRFVKKYTGNALRRRPLKRVLSELRDNVSLRGRGAPSVKTSLYEQKKNKGDSSWVLEVIISQENIGKPENWEITMETARKFQEHGIGYLIDRNQRTEDGLASLYGGFGFYYIGKLMNLTSVYLEYEKIEEGLETRIYIKLDPFFKKFMWDLLWRSLWTST